MEVFQELADRGHEGIYFAADADTGLRVIIGVHSTILGPALGGVRIRDYPSSEAALRDVLRLSKGMTFKAAAASLPLGGGKAVIIGDPKQVKTEPLLEAYGRAVDQLGGTYITAEDVGSTVGDMEVVARTTAHVTGLPIERGGSGDPSPATAVGVVAAMRATAAHLWQSDDLAGRRVAIQGVGKVGMDLLALLTKEGCEVSVADVDPVLTEVAESQHGAKVVSPAAILAETCDILSPCALGGVLNERTKPELHCTAIVGSANNQLEHAVDGDRLADAGITYVPDFIANAGGIVNIGEELGPDDYSWVRAREAVERIFHTTGSVLTESVRRGVTPRAAAMALAEERLNTAVARR